MTGQPGTTASLTTFRIHLTQAERLRLGPPGESLHLCDGGLGISICNDWRILSLPQTVAIVDSGANSSSVRLRSLISLVNSWLVPKLVAHAVLFEQNMPIQASQRSKGLSLTLWERCCCTSSCIVLKIASSSSIRIPARLSGQCVCYKACQVQGLKGLAIIAVNPSSANRCLSAD